MDQEYRKEAELMRGLVTALGVVALEHRSGGLFRLLGDSAPWLDSFMRQQIGPESSIDVQTSFLFLQDFPFESESFWTQPGSQLFKSGTWSEQDPNGNERFFEAFTTVVADKRILLIEDLTEKYRERHSLFQTARESVLNYQRLATEVQEKEILLHCVVHDLAGPLTGIGSCLSWLEQEQLSEACARRLSTGKKAVEKLQSFVREILNVFSAELEAAPEECEAPDITHCAQGVIETLSPAASLRNIRIDLHIPNNSSNGCRVTAEPTRLERLFYNLLDNALRYSPEESRIEVTITDRGRELEVWVEDEGPGVAPEIEQDLFKKFLGGQTHSGRAGLGLYFCSIVVDRWGGTIGYAKRPPQGSRFWFRLPRFSNEV